MKYFNFGRLQFLVLAVAIFVALPAYAQSDVTVTPKTITVAGTRGGVETRTVFLRTKKSITNLRVTAFDLFNADNTVVLPARLIQLGSLSDQPNADELVSFPVKFDLQNAPSGEFNSELLIRYEGDELSIPVIVRLKDPWLLPFLTLLAGVGLSMAVSAYGTEGKQRDEITVSMIQLRTQIDEDKQGKEKAMPFWSCAYMHLEDAKLAHYTKQWEESEKALVEARTVWNKWYRNREEWLTQITYYEDLKKRLEEPDLKNLPSRYIQAVKRSLDDTFQRLPEFTSPLEMRQILAGIGDRIDRYLKLESQLDKINDLSQQIQEDEKRYEWEDKIHDLAEKLQNILPSKETDLEDFENDINDSINQVKKDLSGQQIQVLGQTKSLTNIVPQAPSIRASKNIDAGGKNTTNSIIILITKLLPNAKVRLWLFSVTSYLIAVTLLAGGGFKELYLSRSTFGVNGWSDYFALLVWGFGAEATRSAVTKVVRNWELPTSK